jgi:HK97 family phage portal protein
MTILGTLRGVRNATVESPALPLTSTTLLDFLSGPKVHAGVSVTEHGSLNMPAVWRAVTLIAGTAASLPLHAYKQDGDNRTQLTTGAAAALLDSPHPDLTPFELWELAYGSLCLWGNAYFLKLYDQTGRLAELWWVAPSRVRAGRTSEGTKLYVLDGDEDNPKSDRQILHIPGFGYDGICGVSPIRAARQGIGMALAAEEYGARLFGSGSLATGILQTEQRINKEQADELKERWRDGGTGLESAHDIRVLGSGANFQPLSIPPEDAQFVESRKFQISEIARMFGVPPHLLMDVDGSTSWGTGIEQQTIGWITFGLRSSYLTRVEQRMTMLLRPQAVYARYSIEGLLRGDSAARSTFYTSMWNLGAYSTNDIRRFEDLGPVDGGDIRYRPLNMGVLGEPDPAPQPTPEVSNDPASNDPAAVAA